MRSILAGSAGVAAAVLLMGCVGIAPMSTPLGPIEVGPIGPVLWQPHGRAPIECRGIARDRCEGAGSDPGFGEVERVIVSCIAACTSSRGEFRIDVVVEGRAELAGQGGWDEGQ
jgi:hypothetical protein